MNTPKPAGELRRNTELVNLLKSAVHNSGVMEGMVPGALMQVIGAGAWTAFVPGPGESPKHYDHTPEGYAAFVMTDEPWGLGISLDRMKELVREDVNALAEHVDMTPARAVGTNQHSEDDGNTNTLRTNDRAYALRRLQADKPYLYARVLAGELSPHAAMVVAGFRHRTVCMRVDDMSLLAGTLRENLDDTQLHELVQRLSCEGE